MPHGEPAPRLYRHQRAVIVRVDGQVERQHLRRAVTGSQTQRAGIGSLEHGSELLTCYVRGRWHEQALALEPPLPCGSGAPLAAIGGRIEGIGSAGAARRSRDLLSNHDYLLL